MPSKSKSKNHSRAASKLSHSDQTAPPSPCSSSSATPLPVSELSEENLLLSLEEASSKFPFLIGKSALIGRITDIEAGLKGCKIWLSESSMVAFSLVPGSIVSVSLASSRSRSSSDIPLMSLADESSRHSGFGSGNKMVDHAGHYFALATVFPSCKVLKNGVRLSSNLSCTLGNPSFGSITFVFPVQFQNAKDHVNENDMLHSATINCPSLYKCKELYLDLVPSESGFTGKGSLLPHNDFPAEATRGRVENGKVSSPKTPLFSRSKLSSPNTSQLSSPIREESVSNSSITYGISSDTFDIREIIGDETSKKLLETCTSSWLYSRTLLCGNIVTIPMLSKLCVFQVVDANVVSANSTNQVSTNSTNQDLTDKSQSVSFQAPDIIDHVNDALFIDRETEVYICSPPHSALGTPQKKDSPCMELEHKDAKKAYFDFSKLGGLSKEYAVLMDIISSTGKCTLSRFGLRPTKGVLLHGPPGTGKTSLARLCAHDAGVNLFSVNGPEIVSQYYGESEQALHKVFNSASNAAPAVVFIDELDAIAPARKDGSEELSQRLVATLLNLMDGISRTDGLLVLAATNRPDSIEPALRRPGRLDREIEIGVPSPKQRCEILRTLLSEMEHSLLDIQVQHLATVTHGFVGADLAALCNEAALICLRRYVNLKKSSDIVDEGSPTTITKGSDFLKYPRDIHSRENSEAASSSFSDLPILSEAHKGVDTTKVNKLFKVEEQFLEVTSEDFEKARMKIRPSAMREVLLEVPKVNWEDVGGQKEVKTQLMEAVEWPQKHQDAFKRIGTRPPTGVLMFGPPGCSKTLLARAIASEAGLNFLAVKGPELFSKWVGESEKAVRSLFAKARANSPSVIFFDEIDALAVIRGKESDGISVADRVMSQLLVELDGLQQRVNVTVIAATNRPDKIDPALLRPGRFDRLLYVGPPCGTDREDIFHVHLRRMPCHSDVCIKELALLTEGYTGADISLICREAAVAAIEENLDASEITMKHLKSAIKQVHPSEIQSYQELSTKFQRLVRSSATRNEVGYQPYSSKSNWFHIRALLKFIPPFLYRLPAAFSLSKIYSIFRKNDINRKGSDNSSET